MLHFDGKLIRQTDPEHKTLSIPELFETYNALGAEPLASQNELFRAVVSAAEGQYDDLSEAARLHVDFWKNFLPRRIESNIFLYTAKITNTYQWALEINREGLFYKDISGMYSPAPDRVTAQGFSDFWFYGPLLPIPDPDIRKRIIVMIRNAFEQVGGVAYHAHFPLLEYPAFANMPHWNFGDHVSSDFVNMRDFGVDFGSQNFHDGPVYTGFISFEHCLARPEFARRILNNEVWEDIVSRMPDRGNIPLADNLSIPPHPSIEKEVLKNMVASLDDPAKPDAEHDLETWAAGATALNRMDAAQALWEKRQSEESVTLLLSLFKEDDPEHYWRNVVFNILYKRYSSHTARQWMIQCLLGDREDYFQKSLDGLRFWGLFENTKLAYPALFASLTWSDKQQGTEEFREVVEKMEKLLD
jgi:hypothetical protein